MKEKDFSQTKEQYLAIATELFEQLSIILEKLANLENEYHTIVDKDFDKFESEFVPKYLEIITPICTEKLIQRGYADQISTPAQYEYIKNSYKAIITMKSERKAIIEIYFTEEVDKKHQFTFVKENENYKIDSVKYGFADEITWTNFHI